MSKDLKFLIGLVVITVGLIIGGVSLLGRNSKGDDNIKVLGQDSGIKASPEFYDLGNVPIGGGIVAKEYEIKNTTDKTLKIKKIATSCMCTSAKVTFGESETKFFGMEGHGDQNAPINLEIPKEATAKVTVNFDPAAHGPEGVGPFDRIVWLTFTDPVGVKELKFAGTVVR